MLMRIDPFVQMARTIDPKDESAVRAACVPEVTWLIDQNGNKLTVQKKVMPLYKQALRDAGIVQGHYFNDYGEWWLKYLSIDTVDPTFMQTYTQQYNQQRTEHLQGNRYQIHNIQDVIGLGMTLLKGPGLYDQCVALALLSGRRESEIGVTARFTPYPGDTIHVDFQGQLKGGVEKRDTIIRIPIFGDREKVCAALARLRAYKPWHVHTPHTFDNSVGSDVRKKSKEHFTSLFPQCTLSMSTHALRKVYAAMAEHYCDHRGWATHIYIAHIMGHDPNDETSVKSYEYFQVAG